LRLKDQIVVVRPDQIRSDFHVSTTTSSGTDADGEDNTNSTEEMLRLNNNNNNIINNNEVPDKFQKNLTFQSSKNNMRHFIKNNIPIHSRRGLLLEEGMSPVGGNNINNNNVIKPRLIRGGKVLAPSIEDLKRQLLKSDIDISEIQMAGVDVSEEMDDDEDEGDYSTAAYDENNDENYHQTDDLEEGEVRHPEMKGDIRRNFNHSEMGYDDEDEEEEQEEDRDMSGEEEEEGGVGSTSNQSFYDQDAAGHFVFGGTSEADGESEANYDDEGIVTPSFGMFDELYRHADLSGGGGANSEEHNTSGEEPSSGGGRKRKYFNPCKLCKKNFPSLSMLKKHAKTHLNEEGGSQHVCKFCFEYFPTSAGLSKHLRVHAGENPNVCNICSKSFTSWATLRTHMKIHSGERPFGCDYCGQRFQTKSTLDSHLRIHTGARPHICPICSKSFRTSSPLYRHMRSVHKGVGIPGSDS
jgi:hypothetical protein